MAEMHCPACQEKRRHTEADWLHHPMRGHGVTREAGWTHQLIKPKEEKCEPADADSSQPLPQP